MKIEHNTEEQMLKEIDFVLKNGNYLTEDYASLYVTMDGDDKLDEVEIILERIKKQFNKDYDFRSIAPLIEKRLKHLNSLTNKDEELLEHRNLEHSIDEQVREDMGLARKLGTTNFAIVNQEALEKILEGAEVEQAVLDSTYVYDNNNELVTLREKQIQEARILEQQQIERENQLREEMERNNNVNHNPAAMKI